MPETLKLLGSTKRKITKDQNGEYASHLKITEVVLIHCNIFNKGKIKECNKSFGQLLNISPKNFILLKTFNSEFSYIEIWFTDQNSKLPEREDKINITLVIN